jgi:hypothetical protein
MEIIIFIAVVVVLALLWSGYVKTKKTESDHAIDNWQPPKASPEKEWPFGEKLSEGKIHVKVADVTPVAPTGSENRVEAPAPGKSADDRVEAPAPVAEPTPVKKAPAKKPAAKTPAKKAPAKKSST